MPHRDGLLFTSPRGPTIVAPHDKSNADRPIALIKDRRNRMAAPSTSRPPRASCAAMVLALCLFALTACTAFLVPHLHSMEEAGVFNAPYTYATQGRMAFPIYGEQFFNSFGIHP